MLTWRSLSYDICITLFRATSILKQLLDALFLEKSSWHNVVFPVECTAEREHAFEASCHCKPVNRFVGIFVLHPYDICKSQLVQHQELRMKIPMPLVAHEENGVTFGKDSTKVCDEEAADEAVSFSYSL